MHAKTLLQFYKTPEINVRLWLLSPSFHLGTRKLSIFKCPYIHATLDLFRTKLLKEHRSIFDIWNFMDFWQLHELILQQFDTPQYSHVQQCLNWPNMCIVCFVHYVRTASADCWLHRTGSRDLVHITLCVGVCGLGCACLCVFTTVLCIMSQYLHCFHSKYVVALKGAQADGLQKHSIWDSDNPPLNWQITIVCCLKLTLISF